MKHQNIIVVPTGARSVIERTNCHKVFRKVYLRFLIMRWRAKISFIALMRRQTIIEHFHNSILKSFNELVKASDIPDINED